MKSKPVVKFNILIVIATIGIAMFLIVFSNAKNAEVLYEINASKSEISEYEKEIQILEVNIKNANNINNLELRALELGLMYPDFNNIIYLDLNPKENEELALALKEAVYSQ